MHGLSADRRLGQHFLLDPGILHRIAAAAEPLDGRTVVEIGPGPGGLTRALLASRAARVVAVERDPRCIAALTGLVAQAGGRLALHAADARHRRLAELVPDGPTAVVANLPYNIGTELLLGWFAELDRIERLVLMFQKEVADRLTARPGTADWGRLGVLAQLLCRVERVMELPAAAFVPPPNVASTLVRLTPRPDRPDAAEQRALENVTRAAFGQRRKMLRAALRTIVPEPERLLAEIGIDPRRRAETLDLQDYRRLTAAVRAERPPDATP